jgi:hypothetical protein
MLPFFLLAFFPPLTIVLSLALHQGRRPLAMWTAFALTFSSTAAALHYINVWPRLLAYVNRAVASEHGAAMFSTEKTGWDNLWHYLEATMHFSPFVVILMLAMLLAIPHFVSVIRDSRAGSLKDRIRTKEAAKPLIVWWLLLVAYAVPTLASAKNGFFGTPFMLMAWIGGMHAMYVLYHALLAYARTSALVLHAATGVTVIVLAASLLNTVRDVKWTLDFTNSVDEKHLRRLHAHRLSGEIHQAITRSIHDWGATRNLRQISIDIDDRRHGAYSHPDIYNLRMALSDLSQGRLRLYSSGTPMLGIEIDCDHQHPLMKEALDLPLDRYWPEKTAGKFHNGNFMEIRRFTTGQACTIVVHESNNSLSAHRFEWP